MVEATAAFPVVPTLSEEACQLALHSRHMGLSLPSQVWLQIENATIDTDWRTDDSYHERIRATATTASREYEIEGTVLSLIPLRNRRTTPDGDQLVTRISEGMTEWKWDGRSGYGLSEYLDQIVDGSPVGA